MFFSICSEIELFFEKFMLTFTEKWFISFWGDICLSHIKISLKTRNGGDCSWPVRIWTHRTLAAAPLNWCIPQHWGCQRSFLYTVHCNNHMLAVIMHFVYKMSWLSRFCVCLHGNQKSSVYMPTLGSHRVRVRLCDSAPFGSLFSCHMMSQMMSQSSRGTPTHQMALKNPYSKKWEETAQKDDHINQTWA